MGKMRGQREEDRERKERERKTREREGRIEKNMMGIAGKRWNRMGKKKKKAERTKGKNRSRIECMGREGKG